MKSAARIVFCAISAWSVCPAQPNSGSGGFSSFLRSTAREEKTIFTAPARITARDARWLAPLAGGIAFLAVTDSRNMQERIHTGSSQNRSLAVSNVGTGAAAALPVLLWWHGWRTGDDYQRDTGLSGVRAILNSVAAAEMIRLAVQRARPRTDGGSGKFFSGSRDASSFPSLHAAGAWASAAVIAARYPGWLSKAGIYGLATAVSLTRVTGREHFPGDVAAGAALGWLVGRYSAGTAAPRRRYLPLAERHSTTPGSAYVPLDSWIYPALDRLAATGMIPSQTSGLKPWTRGECRRQLREADQHSSGSTGEAAQWIAALHKELDEADSPGLTVDSVYVRNGFMTGPVLTDGYHFGQTWRDDSGRPFGRGWNSVAGFTAHAESGRFFGSVRGEFQHAPGAAAEAPAVWQEAAALDNNPLLPPPARPPVNRFRLVDAAAGVRIGNLSVSIGKQELWWGPTKDAPLSFSANAEPTKNLKISTVHPLHFQGPLRYLGGIRAEFILGKLGGQQYTWRPWFNAQKVSFKLTENLEMGFTRWSIFWGVGHPLTAGSLLRNFTSTTSPKGSGGVGSNDPGDRKAGFDFRYRLPGLNRLTIYSDSYSDDDPSPLAAPRHAAMNPGVMLTRIPGIPRLDLRVEAPSTSLLDGRDRGGQYIYYNGQYHSGNTNYGVLFGNPVGRDGRAQQGWVTYHLSPRDRVELGYRQQKISTRFLPGGGTQSDATAKSSLSLGGRWFAEAAFQYERFWIPLLGGPQRNLSGWLQIVWEPKWRIEL